MQENISNKNQSVERTFQIIEIMAQGTPSMRLLDIAEKTQLPNSTVLRFLKTLMLYNYVRQDSETLRYSLSLKFCHIGYMISSQLSIRDIVRPYLIGLSKKCQESTCLAQEEDMTVMYIDAVDGPDNMLKTLQRIGKRAPLHCTGVGKLMLLNYDYAKLDLLIAKYGLISMTPNTITNKDDLLAELSKVSENDFALDDEECELGARCLAAPIRDYTGNVIAAISVSGPTNRMTMKKIDEFKTYISEISCNISKALGYKTD